MWLLLSRCQLRHINHASIDIATSILGGRQWHGIWHIRWSPTRYWRILRLWRCVMWISGWLLTNQGHMGWINNWIIKWRRHRYHRLWQLIALWVTVFTIKSPVITRSVLWRYGWLLMNRGQLRWIDDDNSFIFELLSLILNHRLSQGVFRCLLWFFPVPLLWQLSIPFGHGMMNAIWVCGGALCLLFYCWWRKKMWEPTLWHYNCINVWVSVPRIKLITSFLSQFNPN